MNKLRKLIGLAKGKSWKYRIKLNNQELTEEWNNWIIIPAEGYIEMEAYGPIQIVEIDWIDITPIEIKKMGKLIPDKTTDYFYEVTSLLSDLKIDFTVQEKIIRLKNVG